MTHPDPAFIPHFAKLDALPSPPEGSPDPSQAARDYAKCALYACVTSGGPVPTRVTTSAEGGVAVCFVVGDKYADIECQNDGTILAVTSERSTLPTVWEVGRLPSEIRVAVGRIRNFLVPA